MSAAIDRTRWAPRPIPRTLDDVSAIARRRMHRVSALLELSEGVCGEVYFDGPTVLHARVGWALGRRALARLLEVDRFSRVELRWHAMPAIITVARPWAQLRGELGGRSRCAEDRDATTPRARAGTRRHHGRVAPHRRAGGA